MQLSLNITFQNPHNAVSAGKIAGFTIASLVLVSVLMILLGVCFKYTSSYWHQMKQ